MLALPEALQITRATAGSAFTVGTNGQIGAASPNASITDLGNGATQYSLVTERDANGNATRMVNVVAVNAASQIASSVNGATALNGQLSSNNTAAVQTRANVLSRRWSAR